MSIAMRSRLTAVRGTVQRVDAGRPASITLRMQDGAELVCVLPGVARVFSLGDDASLILVDRAGALAVLGAVNHTRIDGENYVRSTTRRRPDEWDAVLVSAAMAGVVGAAGWGGILPFAILTAVYALLTGGVPAMLRERLARRVDLLIDSEVRSATPASPANRGR